MAVKTGQNNGAESGTAVHQIERVNLYDFGYEKAGNVKGDPDIFSSYLKRIANGDLVEENYKGLSDDDKKERLEQIKGLEKQLEEAEKNNSKFETEIKEKETKIDQFRQELLNIREVMEKDHEKIKRETFSGVKFSINLFLLIMLSAYLFFFYVSTAYKALYVDLEAIANKIAEGTSTGSIMPNPYELADAIRFNILLFLVPFVFYAFGWAFHTLLNIKHYVKYILLGLLIAVTFTVDFLLALIIHNHNNSAMELMGLPTTRLGVDSAFYIILFMGFLVYIIWSLLLDSLLREWDKKKITGNIVKIIKHLQKDIKILQKKIVPTGELKARIADYREDVNTVMFGNLKKYVEQFSSGWLSYLAPANMKALKERCMSIKKDFEDKYGIKPGLVKVISKRG